MNSPPSVVVVGSINVDTVINVPHIPAPGETILGETGVRSPGGKGANQAAAAAANGAAVHFVSAVGSDELARVALGNLESLGVGTEMIRTIDGCSTGLAVVLLANGGENSIIVDSGANRFVSEEEAVRAVSWQTHEVLLTQLEVPIVVSEACARASKARWKILNPAPIGAASNEIRPRLHAFNVIVPNRTEIGQLADRGSPQSLAEVTSAVRSLDYDGAVVVTLGEAGAAVFESVTAEPVHLPPPAAVPVDTTGAGDAFCGTLASELALHGNLTRAAECAVVNATESTLHYGAQVSKPF